MEFCPTLCAKFFFPSSAPCTGGFFELYVKDFMILPELTKFFERGHKLCNERFTSKSL